MLQLALHFIARHGYLALLVLQMLGVFALPLPDEFLVGFAGYLSFKGNLHLGLTILTASVGASLGITLSYGLGRFAGPAMLRPLGRLMHMTPDRMDRAHQWAAGRGKWGLTFGYFVPGVRHLIGFTAGTLKLPLRVFWLYACSGALLWSCTFALMGFLLGEQWSVWAARVPMFILLMTLAGAAIALGFLWLRRPNHGLNR